jgi:predicted GIY-YIG superfamily endonuclease
VSVAVVHGVSAPIHKGRPASVSLSASTALDALAWSDWRHRIVVYRAYDAAGALLYVGVSGRIRQRLYVHRHNSAWWAHAASVHLEWIQTRAEAEGIEAAVIREEQPPFNRAGVRPERFRAPTGRFRSALG